MNGPAMFGSRLTERKKQVLCKRDSRVTDQQVPLDDGGNRAIRR
jgi:hypothetical protein